MPLGEFELIDRFFRRLAADRSARRGDVPLGIGDDAALLVPPPGRWLVAALDALVEGRHFPPGVPPASIGHRALAVNLSDLAAMGAEPAWFLLSLTLPTADEHFLAEFARGMFELAEHHGMALVGGDTTGGPLVAAVQAMGTVAPGAALTRAGGHEGDLLYVSGTPGDAAAGLQLLQGTAPAEHLDALQRRTLEHRFLYPLPRVALGQAIAGLASACIDVSDGLAADAGRLAKASGCGVRIDAERLSLSPELRILAGDAGARRLALTGGEDCELCFAVPPGAAARIAALQDIVKCPLTCIGSLVGEPGTHVCEQGRPLPLDTQGFDHFAGT